MTQRALPPNVCAYTAVYSQLGFEQSKQFWSRTFYGRSFEFRAGHLDDTVLQGPVCGPGLSGHQGWLPPPFCLNAVLALQCQ